ncbi:hypothetical protein [Chthonobacter albigriseus]|uniref:hypothetical protein n=1 Tax=Chthonobacter albigriseus TaxID=1683161 RepID=UPI0015EE7ECF|nr:hypothetical protein [Chthonobacter albigriseus]
MRTYATSFVAICVSVAASPALAASSGYLSDPAYDSRDADLMKLDRQANVTGSAIGMSGAASTYTPGIWDAANRPQDLQIMKRGMVSNERPTSTYAPFIDPAISYD